MELYKRISVVKPYDDKVLHQASDEAIESELNNWLAREKPAGYRIINGETIFIQPFELSARRIGPRVVFVLHVAYTK